MRRWSRRRRESRRYGPSLSYCNAGSLSSYVVVEFMGALAGRELEWAWLAARLKPCPSTKPHGRGRPRHTSKYRFLSLRFGSVGMTMVGALERPQWDSLFWRLAAGLEAVLLQN